MVEESVMETATTAGAGVAITTPLWMHSVNPYLQFVALVLGITWIGMQMFYKIRNERKKAR
jgi:hypothetical protein